MYQAEFIGMGTLSGDSRFNIEACIDKRDVKILFKWLPDAFFKKKNDH